MRTHLIVYVFPRLLTVLTSCVHVCYGNVIYVVINVINCLCRCYHHRHLCVKRVTTVSSPSVSQSVHTEHMHGLDHYITLCSQLALRVAMDRWRCPLDGAAVLLGSIAVLTRHVAARQWRSSHGSSGTPLTLLEVSCNENGYKCMTKCHV